MVEKDNEDQDVVDAKYENIKRIIRNIKDSRDHLSETKTQMRTDYDYYAGRQWSEDDQKILDEQKRPAVVMNRIPRTINAVCGLEIHNRQEVRLLPRENSDTGVVDTSNASIKWARENCDAEDEDSQGFQDILICGYGYTETKMDYEINPEGDIVVHRIDPLQMLYDPCSRKKNLADAKWMAREIEMYKEEIEQMWPNADLDSAFTLDNHIASDDPHDANEADKYKNDQSGDNYKGRKLKVIQYEEYQVKPIYRAVNPFTGQIEELNKETFEQLQTKLQEIGQPLQHVKQKKRVYTQTFLLGDVELESNELICGDFTFKAQTGLYDRNKNVYFGLVRLMRDPQMWANKWMSQIMHILNSNAKSGIMAEVGAFNNIKNAERDWSSPDKIVLLNDGALQKGKIQERAMPRYPEGIDRLLQYAMQGINDTSGVSLEFLGLTDRDQAGVIEAQRMKQGTLILAPFFDSLRRYRKMQGRLMFNYIREYIADGRLIRIVGDQGAQYVPLIKDQMTFKYDIIVDDAPTSPNVKERTFAILSRELVPLALQSGLPVPPDILDYAPLPQILIEKWKQMLQPNPQEDQQNQAMQQLQMTLLQLEALNLQVDAENKSKQTEKMDSDIALNFAKAQQSVAVAQDENAQAQQKLGLAHHEAMSKERAIQHEAQIRERQMLIDSARKNVESMMTMKRKAQEAQMNTAIKAQQAKAQMEIAKNKNNQRASQQP